MPRRVVLAGLVSATVGLCACGTASSRTPSATDAGTTVAAAQPSPNTASNAAASVAVPPGPLTASQVIRVFAATSSIQLQVFASTHGYQELLPTNADYGDAVAKFGPFVLYLVRPGRRLGPAAIFGGKHGRAGPDGIMWFPPDAEPYWFAAKQYRNLWVQWKGGIHRGTNPLWAALAADLQPLA
jgi:hypothetical protein